MKNLDNNHYVEVKDHHYKFHPTKNNKLGLPDDLLQLIIKFRMILILGKLRKS